MPNTPGGLPYPAATEPVAGGAAAIQALATAVEGLYLVGEVILTAQGTVMELAAGTIPPKWSKLIVDAAIVPTGANGTITTVLFDTYPDPGANWMGYASGQGGTNGQGPGGYQGVAEIPCSRISFHGVEAATVHRWFGTFEIPFYYRAQRHAVAYRTFGKTDYAGNMSGDLNHLAGTAYESVNAPGAITGVRIATNVAMGVGSRMTVYGAGKLAPSTTALLDGELRERAEDADRPELLPGTGAEPKGDENG